METTKNKYDTPTIKAILIDNEISLALTSSPPIGPGETRNTNPEFIYKNPFNTING